MNTLDNTFSVTDLRHKTNKILDKVGEVGLAFLVRRSKTEAAIIDIEYLRALQEAYEDYMDTLDFDENIKQKRVALNQHKKKYLESL